MERLLNPRSIAIVGASTNITKMGSLITFNVQTGGFQGEVYPINPKAKKVHGYKAYPSVLACPTPDLAAIIVPKPAVPEVLDQCAHADIRNVILVTGGYREMGPEGKAAEDEVKAIAQKHRFNMVGPNCVGMSRPSLRLNLTTMPYAPPAGPVAFVSQSGAFMAQNFIALQRWGLGVSTTISTGNEAILTCTDYIKLLSTDPETRVIILYIEGFRDGPQFLNTAKQIVPHKPILLMKVGRTSAGQRAAASHTGAMAGDNTVFQGAMQQAGVILGKSLEDLFDWSMALAHQSLPKGPRVAILTNSGGPGVSFTDVCAEEGLTIPPLSDNVQQQLRAFLPPTAITDNPVDSTFTVNMRLFAQCAEVLLTQPNIDALLIHGFFGPDLMEQFRHSPNIPQDVVKTMQDEFGGAANRLINVLQRHRKPVLISSTQDRSDSGIRALQDAGIPVYPMPERAARTLGVMTRYTQRQHRA
ncbi:MAG: CoA-binding protein [Candidatus Hermodarchaeota archaeon]|nr:CoA-binding protein [Candidatus Hermodarchaeota archaeon]